MKKPIIIGGRDDGFGERMRALLNAIFVAQELGLEWGFVWPDYWEEQLEGGAVKSPMANLPKMSELFSEDFIRRYQRPELPSNYLIPVLERHYQKSIKNLLTPPFEHDWGWYMTQGDLDVWFKDVSRAYYRKSLASIFASMDFSPEARAVFRLVDERGLGDFVALHIRSGESLYKDYYVKTWWHCRYKVSPYPLNVAVALDELKKGHRVVLFSDDFPVCDAIKSYLTRLNPNYEGKIFTATELKPSDLKGWEDLLFDVYLMSKAKRIYCSWTTGFARFACYIGHNELIALPEHYSVAQSYELMVKFIDIEGVHPRQAGFCYFFLYLLAKDLNLPFEMRHAYLERSFEIWPNDSTQLFRIDLLLERGLFEEAEALLGGLSPENRQDLLTLMLEYPGFNPTFPFHIFSRYFLSAKYHHLTRFAFEIYLAFYDEKSIANAYHPGFREPLMHAFGAAFSPAQDSQPTPQNIDIYKRHSLAYTLGRAMIENSKSLLGYIRMPYVLSYLREQHAKETQRLRDEDGYCKFYNEAGTLSVELGRALIRAHKAWFKGGYIKLIFIDIPLIKKNFKERR